MPKVNRRIIKFIRPITCADCGEAGKVVVDLTMTVAEDWTIDESSLEVTGRHKDCQKTLVGGALEGVLGEPDVSGITEKGSVHKHWTNPDRIKSPQEIEAEETTRKEHQEKLRLQAEEENEDD
jgi:hypothetical protein